jgi:hypothetical protein
MMMRNGGGVQPGNDQAKQSALRIADALEANWTQTNQQMVRTEHLMELAEEIAKELSLLAQDWEPVDPQRAERWRVAEHQVRALGLKFAQFEEMEAADAKAMIASMRQLARQAQGH